MPQCTNCKTEFAITDADRVFYQQLSVPEPRQCPQCRMQLMMSFRNQRKLRARQCDRCQKSIIAMYPAESPYTVYCQECWWSDAWEGRDYGAQYVPGESLWTQLERLQQRVPRIALFNLRTENAEYNNHIGEAKDCYASSVIYNDCEDIYYSYWLLHNCQACVDCSMGYRLRQSYDCFRVTDSYHCIHCQRCSDLVDSAFCFDCRGGQKLLFCTGLRGQSCQVLNKPVSEAEFEQAYQAVLHSASAYQAAVEKFTALIAAVPRRCTSIVKSEHCIGDELTNATDCFQCFDLEEGQNNRYVYAASRGAQDCMDCYGVLDARYSYFCTNTVNNQSVQLSRFIWDSADITYSDLCFNSSNLFGCIGLRHQRYCILNKQYSPEEYERLRQEIIRDMTASGEYGEFFPPVLSPFPYNESAAHEHFPLTPEAIVAGGWQYAPDATGTTGKETVTSLPDAIEDVPDTIAKEIIACTACGRNYKIIAQELAFYRQHAIPLPRHCPDCRYAERQSNLLPYRLWSRTCAQCQTPIETSYAPDRPEKVYCEECYQKEIY